MKKYLGVLMMLMVSGDNEVTIRGTLEDSVLLPCTCSDRNLDKEFKWQMDEPNPTRVFVQNTTTSDFYDRYKGRAKIFVAENSNNCSLHLTDITVDDQGKYKCSFSIQEQYTRFFINLIISATYSVCQSSARNLDGDVGENVFHCDVRGRYREAEIQWYLDGKPLTNSSTTNITHTYPMRGPFGRYHFNSKLISELSWTSKPKCDVKTKVVSPVIRYDCETTGQPRIQDVPAPKYSIRYLKFIPVVLVLILSLVLWRHWNTHSN